MVTEYAQLAKRLPNWLYKSLAQSYIDRNYPRHLFLETTAKCNLHCSYCPREDVSNHMDFQLLREIVAEASRYGARSFSLHLFGEPLLYPYLFEACEEIKRRNKRHTILLTTNGTLLNRYVDDLVQSGVSKVLWTWRSEAKFRPETRTKLRKWGRFCVRFIDEVTTEEAREEWKDWPNVEGRRMHNYGGQIDLQPFGVQNTDGQRWPCYHLWLAPAVSWNGNLLLCCADAHQKEVLGKFPDQTVASVWGGSRLKAIRESHLRGEYGGICKDCDVWKIYPDIFFGFQKKLQV